MRAFLDATPPLPEWHDDTLIHHGQDVFRQWAPEVGLALFVASLPAGYAGHRGASVLAATGRLVSDPRRRIFETAQFLVHLMDAGSLEPGGTAYRDARRVRLLHAAVRHLLLDAGWDPACRRGLPVNQEDLLGTLWTFSLVTLDVLDLAGIELRPGEADAYLHLWEVAGELLGIERGLLPVDLHAARRSFAAIRRRQYGSSEEGTLLAGALVTTLDDLVPIHLHGHLVPDAVRHYAGSEVADILDMPARPASSPTCSGWAARSSTSPVASSTVSCAGRPSTSAERSGRGCSPTRTTGWRPGSTCRPRSPAF